MSLLRIMRTFRIGACRHGARAFRYPGLGLLVPLWASIGAMAYARRYVQAGYGGPALSPLPDFLGWIGCYLPWALLSQLAFRIERRFQVGSGRPLRNLCWVTLIGVPFTYGASVLMTSINRVIRLSLGVPHEAIRGNWFFTPCEILVAGVLYSCCIAAGSVIRTLIDLNQQEKAAARLAVEKAELERDLRRAELEMLRARLNPHFLFNTLQNISVLTQQDPRLASRMLTRLGDLLRVVLRRDTQPEATLESEIAITESYVALEKMRFGDRLTVCFETAPEALSALVPSFLLQPLLENALVHGLNTLHGGIIIVRAAIDSDRLSVSVADNGIGPPAENIASMRMGLGLGSTAERLARLYPDRHSLAMHRLPEGGTEVRIMLPLRRAEARAAAPPAYAPLAHR